MRITIKKNYGKIFENNFKASICEDYCFIKRLQDSVGTWSGGSNLRFSNNNECDYLIFNKNNHNLYAFELKTTEHSSLTFWKEDFEDKDKKQSFMIKKNQILGLKKMAQYNIVAGLVINFRNDNNDTYFIHINDFLEMVEDLSKKSFNLKDLIDTNSYTTVDSTKLRTNFRYNVEKLMEEIRCY